MGLFNKIFSFKISSGNIQQFNPMELITEDELKKAKVGLEDEFKDCISNKDYHYAAIYAATLHALNPNWKLYLDKGKELKSYLEKEFKSALNELSEDDLFSAAIKLIPLRVLFPEWHPDAEIAEMLRLCLTKLLEQHFTMSLLARTMNEKMLIYPAVRFDAQALKLLFNDWQVPTKMDKNIIEYEKDIIQQGRKIGNFADIGGPVADLLILYSQKKIL